MKKVRFTKMHGAGNDFVLIDDRAETFPVHDHLRLAALATARTGIACEGVILVQPSKVADFHMAFFNPDGTEADLCGNGARCVAAFAREIGVVRSPAMTFHTRAGLVDAEIVGPGSVKLWMPEPRNRRYNMQVQLQGQTVTGDYVEAGVPHFIVPCASVAAADVEHLGRVQYIAPRKALMRTYERGVEAESGACGTGAVAVAIVGVETKGMSLPFKIRTSQGYELVVDGDWRQTKGTGFTLTGPVKKVFEGEIDLDSLDIGTEME